MLRSLLFNPSTTPDTLQRQLFARLTAMGLVATMLLLSLFYAITNHVVLGYMPGVDTAATHYGVRYAVTISVAMAFIVTAWLAHGRWVWLLRVMFCLLLSLVYVNYALQGFTIMPGIMLVCIMVPLFFSHRAGWWLWAVMFGVWCILSLRVYSVDMLLQGLPYWIVALFGALLVDVWLATNGSSTAFRLRAARRLSLALTGMAVAWVLYSGWLFGVTSLMYVNTAAALFAGFSWWRVHLGKPLPLVLLLVLTVVWLFANIGFNGQTFGLWLPLMVIYSFLVLRPQLRHALWVVGVALTVVWMLAVAQEANMPWLLRWFACIMSLGVCLGVLRSLADAEVYDVDSVAWRQWLIELRLFLRYLLRALLFVTVATMSAIVLLLFRFNVASIHAFEAYGFSAFFISIMSLAYSLCVVLVAWLLARNAMFQRQQRGLIQQAEIARYQAQEANIDALRAAQVRDQFISNMSHEIRNPLNSIYGAIQIAQQRMVAGELPAADVLTLLRENTERLLAMIEKLFMASRIEQGAMHVLCEAEPLAPLLAKPVRKLQALAKSKQLDFIWQPDQAKGLTVMVDRNRLEQVLVQLLENAIKFTDEGSIHISVAPIAKQVVITIKDTGMGMHEAQLNEVMQGVGQVDPSLTKRVSGGGLGLSISRWLIQQMGGELTVTSSPNEGTQVSLTLERYVD